MPKGSILAVVAAALLVLPAAGAARAGQTVERVRVAGPGVTSAFPKGISLQLVSPPAYGRRGAGAWAGPAYWATGDRSLGGKVAIRWNVSFLASKKSAKQLALTGSVHGWPREKKDPIAIPHVIGKRVVGTIRGYYLLTRSPAPDDALFEAVLAFPLAPHAYSLVRFDLTAPKSDSAGAAGDYVVAGLDVPSIWNRGQAYCAMTGVRVAGNLPPSQVSLAVGGRHVLRGSVSDSFRDPVVRVPVALERRVGSSWRRLTRTKTNRKGKFAIRIGRRGAYRAVAISRGKAVPSRTVVL